jgi:hypothetical protein
MSDTTEANSQSEVIANALSDLRAVSQPKHYTTMADANAQGYVTLEQYVNDVYKDREKPPNSTTSKEFRRMFLDDKLERISIKDGSYVKWGYRAKKPS